MNILLVDDSLIIRSVLENTLKNHPDAGDFSFFSAENGQVAHTLLLQKNIDIMFLDWHMPLMTGEDLVYKLRENKKFNKLRIIMATTEGGKESVMKMAKKGINAYLIKPFDEEVILKTFNTIYARIKPTK